MAVKIPLLGGVLQRSDRRARKHRHSIDYAMGYHEQLCMLVHVGNERPSFASNVGSHA